MANLEAEEAIDLKDAAVLGETIVGVKAVSLGERLPGALKVTPLPSPQEPAPAQRDRHDVSGHTKYEVWFPICVASRGLTITTAWCCVRTALSHCLWGTTRSSETQVTTFLCRL